MSTNINEVYLKALQLLQSSGNNTYVETPSSGNNPVINPGNINGANEYGLVGDGNVDGFSLSADSSTGSSGTVEELENGNAALNSTDKGVVSDAKQGVDEINPKQTAPATAALSAVSAAEGAVTNFKENLTTAIGGKEKAQGAEEAAQTNKTEKTKTVNAQKADLQTKETNLAKAEAAEVKAQANVTAAKATVASAQATVKSAEAAVAAASAAVPFSAPALAAAEAALAAAQAALKAAEAKLALAEAELERATAQKEVATAERDQSKAKLENDKQALEKAEQELSKAKEELAAADQKVEQAQSNLEKAQADLSTKKEAYEKIKGDIESQASDLSKDLDELLKELEEKEDVAGSVANTGNTSHAGKKTTTFEKVNQAIGSFANLGQGLTNMFTQNSATQNSSSKKPPMTPQQSAELSKTLYSTGAFIKNLQNGGTGTTNFFAESGNNTPANSATSKTSAQNLASTGNSSVTNPQASAAASLGMFRKNLV